MFRGNAFFIALAVIAMGVGSLDLRAQSVDTLVVPDSIKFAEKARIRDKVRNECRLEAKQSRFIREYASKVYANIVSEKPSTGSYHILSAEIYEVHAPGGGAWSGTKHMKVRGTLKDQSGKVLGTFDAGRYSGGGAFGGYKGTCSIIGRCTRAIGKDIGIWMVSPTKDAFLGDL